MKKAFPLLCMASASIMAFASLQAYADDEVVPFDPVSGKVLVAPEDSILAEDVTVGHPNSKPPPYTLLRYTERYSYLADSAKHTDTFDQLKYIPLDQNNPESYLSFGGEIRERYETYHNQGFGVSGTRGNDYGLQRILLHADLHANERLRFFVQGISSLQFGGQFKAPINQDPLDFQQVFADYTFGNPLPDGDRLTIRGGRFSMAYGSSRLVATRAAPNTPLKFDGLQLIGSSGGKSKVYAFLTRPVQESRYHLDTPNQDQAFYGVYTTEPITTGLSADLYYLGFRNDKASYIDANGVENRHSVGTRVFGTLQSWDYDIEAVYQFGSVGIKDIKAWTIATDAGYTFEHQPWRPRLGIKFDIASGDRHKGNSSIGTFNPLFFKAGYFNDASLLRPANITDLHFSLQMQPIENVTATFGSDVIWRFSREDAVYGTNGAVALPANADSAYIGTTAEAAIQWKASRHVVGTLSYVHLYTDNYVKSVGGGDVDYGAAWVSYLW